MDHDEAAARLSETQRLTRLTARSGAWLATGIVSAGVLAMGMLGDLDMWWLAGVIMAALAGLWVARPLRSRFDWSDRIGAWLVIGGGVAALAAYILVQFPVRAAGWSAPNTLGAVAAVIIIVTLCRLGLQRMASAAGSPSRTPGALG